MQSYQDYCLKHKKFQKSTFFFLQMHESIETSHIDTLINDKRHINAWNVAKVECLNTTATAREQHSSTHKLVQSAKIVIGAARRVTRGEPGVANQEIVATIVL